jgi:histone deacetylase 1/2
VLVDVLGLEHAAEIWKTIGDIFSAQSEARVGMLRAALTNTKKRELTAAVYIAKMKGFASELAAAGRVISDIELKEYLLAGLAGEYNALVASINANPATSSAGVCNQLMAYDYRQQMLSESEHPTGVFTSSANAAARGRGSRPGHGGGYRHGNNNYGNNNYGNNNNYGGGYHNYGGGRNQQRGRPPRRQDAPDHARRPPSNGGRGRGRGRGRRTPSPYQDIMCQICKKDGHPATECWWRYGDDDDDSHGDEKGAHMASYGVDTNWYIDTGATDHITSELSKLSTHEHYKGHDQVHNASGQGMAIKHIGHSVLHTPHNSIHLRNILHVPSASKNLLSAHKIALDNNAFVEFHPFFFLIKDQATKQIIFKGPCHGGLYPLVPIATGSSKHAFVTLKPSSSTWHRRLGHPSSFVVQQILRRNNLPHSHEINPYVCDPCQQAKSHQLPYPTSTSVSVVPLEQIFSDVWGPAPTSYYVSFIDDFSKFTWIYLLKKCLDVYQVFLNFQQYVERKFNHKIVTMQTDWGGEYEKLNSFFQKIGITHHVSCTHAHQQNGSAERKHRHIVEVGLSLLANASMPLKFWD